MTVLGSQRGQNLGLCPLFSSLQKSVSWASTFAPSPCCVTKCIDKSSKHSRSSDPSLQGVGVENEKLRVQQSWEWGLLTSTTTFICP